MSRQQQSWQSSSSSSLRMLACSQLLVCQLSLVRQMVHIRQEALGASRLAG
jgi:hypothetical protein